MNGSCIVYPERRVIRQVLIDAPRGKETEFIFNLLHDEIENAPAELSAHCLSPESGKEVDPTEFNRKDVVGCGVPNPDIADLQSRMLDHAIYPRRVELGTIGVIGALQEALVWQESKVSALFLELEDRVANAVIIGPKGIEMSRKVEAGTLDIAEALKEELSLKDMDAAFRLLSSKDFDLSSISRKILRKLLRELQSSIGFYEVQTGQSVSWIHTSSRSVSMDWLEESIGSFLNLESFQLEMEAWLESSGVSFASEELSGKIDLSWIGLFSTLCSFNREVAAA